MESETSSSPIKRDTSPTPVPKQPIPPPRKKLTPKLIEWCSSENLDRATQPKDNMQSSQKLIQSNEEGRLSVGVGSRRQSVGGWSVASTNSQSDNRSYRQRLRDHIQSVKEGRLSVGVGSRRQSVGGWSVASTNSQSDNRSYRQRLRDHIQSVKEGRLSVGVGSRRQSVGGWSVASSTNSQSDNRSYRQRLRDHIQSVKEQAGTSITSAGSRMKYNLKPKSHVEFHDLLGREESEVEAALERHEEMRKKWKHMAHASLEAEAGHNFMTKEWEDEQTSAEAPNSPIQESIEEEQLENQYMKLPEDWQLVDCYVEATLDDLSLRIHKENQLYYFPSDLPVKLEEKLGLDNKPRYVEDEGLYVGLKPQCSSKSYNKLQQRLVAEDRRHWFGIDGELKTFLAKGLCTSSDPLLKPLYKYAELMRLSEPTIRDEPIACPLYLLELEVGTVCWTHHPLCGPEHVAAQLVQTRYQEYNGRLRAGLGRRLAHKLQALRTARDTAKRGRDFHSYQRYKVEVKKTRKLRLEEGCKDRQAAVNCLTAWLELRRVRSRQGYSLTPVKLNIIELDGAGDNVLFGAINEWESELKSQVAEILEEEEEAYQRTLEKLQESSTLPELSNEQELKPFHRRSSAEILEEVKLKLSESLSPPGEPVIALELGEESITPVMEITDSRELERHAAQKRCHLSIRVLCDKQVVCRSRPLTLYPHFATSLNQLFSLQISVWPQSLSLELTMEGGIGPGKRLSASVFVPVPPGNTTLAGAPVEMLEFNSVDKLGPYPHTGVGCGMQDGDNGVLFAGGQVTCRVGWGNLGGPPRKPSLSTIKNGHKILNQLGNLREWANRAQLDPNDPSNADLFEFIKNEEVKSTMTSNNEVTSANLEFCTMAEIENNPRLKLLSLRNQVVPEFKDIQNVPIRDREIPDDIFKMYEKRIESPLRSGPGVGETGLEWQREWGRQQLSLIRDKLEQHCRQVQQPRKTHQVVLEDQVPDIGTLGLTFMKWLQPKRPLHPVRKERKKFPVIGLLGQEVEVIVNVVRAFDVPVRMDVDPLINNGLSLVPVRPFVEVSFQNRKSRTTTAEGANPTWNQDLRIPVKFPSGGAASWMGVQDKLYCQLYDETVVDLLEDDRQRETNIHQRLQRHWLGSLQIPFSSLCTNPRIEGTFQLYSPTVLLGYQREGQPNSTSTNNTFLTLFITVNPPLHPLDPFKERLPCSEMPFVEQHLDEWRTQVAMQFPHRPVRCLVVDTSAKSVCVTRFFHPLVPPVLEEEESRTPEMALRFVSKIPMVHGNMLFPGLFDVWLTAQEITTLLSGSAEDHAVLLCCYLQQLGFKCWLVLGTGVPHGPMALVFTPPNLLWDPATGLRYHIHDTFCPLQRVFCLINHDNIWANVQREEAVSRTRFDVTRRTDWWPAFNRNVATPVGSVQPASIEYLSTVNHKTDAALLQDKLEKVLRESIVKWRPTTRTIWNRYITVKLRKLLPGLEKAALSGHTSVASEHLSQLSQTLSSHKMCGFTLNFAFTNTEEIVEAVRATGIHYNESSDVEFALAVYVHPFVCGVLSVWVYITSLTLRR